MQQLDSSRMLGVFVRSIRLKRGLTQGELAKLAGLRQATVSEVENGHEGVRIRTLLLVFGALGCMIFAAAQEEAKVGGFTKWTEEW